MQGGAGAGGKKQIQIIILGDGSVGKTSIIKQFSEKEFNEEHITTLGLDYVSKKFTNKAGQQYTIKIWDTAGQERFKTLTYAFYKKADGVIICYDITEPRTFENVTNWIESIHQNANTNVAKILLGNKVDMEDQRQVQKQSAELLAQKNEMKYLETSAKENIGIEEAMAEIFEQSINSKFGGGQNQMGANGQQNSQQQADPQQRKSVMLGSKQHRESKPAPGKQQKCCK